MSLEAAGMMFNHILSWTLLITTSIVTRLDMFTLHCIIINANKDRFNQQDKHNNFLSFVP